MVPFSVDPHFFFFFFAHHPLNTNKASPKRKDEGRVEVVSARTVRARGTVREFIVRFSQRTRWAVGRQGYGVSVGVTYLKSRAKKVRPAR